MKILLKRKQQERNRKEEIKNWFSNYKKTVSCLKCGEKNNLEFHHRLPGAKKETISSLIRRGEAMERILDEIKKCDILCTKCHRDMHEE